MLKYSGSKFAPPKESDIGRSQGNGTTLTSSDWNDQSRWLQTGNIREGAAIMAMSKTNDLAVALLGAAGGALAVYLLDPDSGEQRRDKIKAATGNAVDQALEQLESLVETARTSVAAKVDEVVKPVADAARSRVADATGAASNARDVASRAIEDARAALDELRQRGGRAASALRGEKPSSHVVPIALGAVSVCAIGVGLMWLMDPERGRSRRANLGQQARRVLNQTSRTFHRSGRHLRNKMTGYASVAERSWKESSLAGETVTPREETAGT